jgi:cytochrome c oxidase cbb3-type subunit IV
MDPVTYGWVAGISTLISMLAFIGVVIWSYSRRRAADFDQAAQMPLEEDSDVTPGARS